MTTLQILLYMSLMLTRYQKIMTSFALLLLFLSNQPAGAESVFSQLKTLEQAVNITLNRLESDIQIDPATGPAAVDFAQRAGQQLQMTLVGLGRESLLQEDYYHLCLYLLARKTGNYTAALEPLDYEIKMAEMPKLRQWLQLRLSMMHELAAGKVPEERDFSIAGEFSDLRRLLRR
ncbi:hypothetical protein MASR1M12_06950 [Erysipelotrichia bacterium]